MKSVSGYQHGNSIPLAALSLLCRQDGTLHRVHVPALIRTLPAHFWFWQDAKLANNATRLLQTCDERFVRTPAHSLLHLFVRTYVLFTSPLLLPHALLRIKRAKGRGRTYRRFQKTRQSRRNKPQKIRLEKKKPHKIANKSRKAPEEAAERYRQTTDGARRRRTRTPSNHRRLKKKNMHKRTEQAPNKHRTRPKTRR